jgi:UDP-arabinose 4-epimerase
VAVIHFAALAYVGESNEDPAAYYRNNVGGTAELLGAMRDADVHRIVFSSTCAVYGTPESVPIRENMRYAPINPYGATKMVCERMLHESAQASPLRFTALRYFNAAGADPDGEIGECHVPETHAIPLVLESAACAQKTFTIFGDDYPTPDGTCIRDYIHVADLADAHVKSLRALMDGSDTATFNIGTGRGWSVRELIDTAARVTGREVPVRVGPRRPGDPAELVADPGRAKERLGWVPRYPDLLAQVQHAWAWHNGGRKKWSRSSSLPDLKS